MILIANADQQILISIDLFFRFVKITHSVEPLRQASDIKTQTFWAKTNKSQMGLKRLQKRGHIRQRSLDLKAMDGF